MARSGSLTLDSTQVTSFNTKIDEAVARLTDARDILAADLGMPIIGQGD